MDFVECLNRVLKRLLGPGKDTETLLQLGDWAGMQTSENISEEQTLVFRISPSIHQGTLYPGSALAHVDRNVSLPPKCQQLIALPNCPFFFVYMNLNNN